MTQLNTPVVPARHRSAAALALSAALLLSACASTDEFAGKSNGQVLSEGQSSLSDGNYTQAVKALEALEGRTAGSALGQQVQLDLAYAYYKNGDKVLALTTLDRFIRYNPSSPALDYAFYLKGVISFIGNQGFFGRLTGQDLAERDQQSARDSYKAFAQLVSAFPNSKYAPDSRQRMAYIVNALARNELDVADFYFQRGAYQAAVNRSQEVIREFPNTPANEAALWVLAQAYGHMGLNDLQSDTLRVLKASFPNSEYLSRQPAGLIENSRPWWRFW
ncbi:outer membrane protein assembly factor BamD [Amphibiibacter pelophylacis]|uniref:Outer membrane protein assembly factor BamD n=1 Tax=Amphibiibacter pelophylacis TaxID=1799477 RepID=A0ACC6P3C1_9BURK